MSEMKSEIIYLVVKGVRAKWSYKDPKPITEVIVTKMLKNKPAKLLQDEVYVKVKVSVPVDVFDPPELVVSMEVPEGFFVSDNAEIVPVEPDPEDTVE